MKKISNKDIKNGNVWCSFCQTKTLAKYKYEFNKACEYHKLTLERLERENNDSSDDYKIWNRI